MRTLLCLALLLSPLPLAAQEPPAPCEVVGGVLRRALESGAIARVCTRSYLLSDELALSVEVALLKDPARLKVQIQQRWKGPDFLPNDEVYEVGLDGRVRSWGERGRYVGGLFRLPGDGHILRWSEQLLIPNLVTLVLSRLADQGLPEELPYWRLSQRLEWCGELGVIRRTKEGVEVGHPDSPTVVRLRGHALSSLTYPSQEDGTSRAPLLSVTPERYAQTLAAWAKLPSTSKYGLGYGAAGGSVQARLPVGEELLKPWRVAMTRLLGKAPQVSGLQDSSAVELRVEHDDWTLRRWIPKREHDWQPLGPQLRERLLGDLLLAGPPPTGALVYERRGRHVVQLEATKLVTPARILQAGWAGAAGAPQLSERLTLRLAGGEVSTYRVSSEVECPLEQAALKVLFDLRLEGKFSRGNQTAQPRQSKWLDPQRSDRARFVFPTGAVLEVAVAEGGGYLAWARSAQALAQLQRAYAKVSGDDAPFAVGLGGAEER